MARRDLEEINAGSMADIAFLLLVFFLVVTTMNNDQGLSRLLPPPIDDNVEPPDFYDRDVFEVLVNFKNELLVEGEAMNVGSLRASAREFLIANGDNVLEPLRAPLEDFPHRKTLNRDSVMLEITRKEQELEQLNKEQEAAIETSNIDELSKVEKAIKAKQSSLDKSLAIKYAFDFFPGYAPLPGSALISVMNDNSTQYGTYVAINNELEGAINDLRNEVSLNKFGIPFDELDSEDDEDKKKILAIRQVYPQRISEAEPIDAAGYLE